MRQKYEQQVWNRAIYTKMYDRIKTERTKAEWRANLIKEKFYKNQFNIFMGIEKSTRVKNEKDSSNF